MKSRLSRLAPAAILVVLVAVSVAVWRGQIAHRNELLVGYTQTVADQAAIRLGSWFQARMAGLSVMTEELARGAADDSASTRGDFLSLATAFQRAQPGFQAINWIGAAGHVRLVVPRGPNQAALGVDISRHRALAVRAAFARARAETTVTVTDCIEMLQGGMGFASYWPVVSRGRLIGYVNGVFCIQESVRAALASGVFDDFRLDLRQDSTLIFASDEPAPARAQGVSVERRVLIPHGEPWRLELTPRAVVASRYGTVRSRALLLASLAISLVLAGLAQALIRRTEAVREARDEAMRELAERRRLEVEKEQTIVQLEQVNRALAEANRELDAYVYAASHDVRAPLVAVSGLVDILLEPMDASDAQERQHIIGRVRHNIRKLDTLVQDMLIVSSSRRLERTTESIDIAAMFEEVWASVRDLGAGAPMEFTLDVARGPWLRTDPLRFRQIVNNLLSNAVKYRDPAKPVLRVVVAGRLTPGRDGRNWLDLTVRDNGIGVPSDCVSRIFEMFYKASGDAFGSGLGLYIVRQHCAALGGEVSCTPLSDGTEFRILLPEDA